MVLCFGTFASILNCCKQNLPQDKFVPRIAWVVDRRNSSLGSEIDFDVEDPADIDGNKPVVTRLLSCQRPLVLRDKQLPSHRTAKERFASQVMPSMNESMIAKALLAVLYVIQSDSTIENEYAATFKENLGVSKDKLLTLTKFNAPDFFARVLRYTTYIDNKAGRPYAGKITEAFIERVADECWSELKWHADTQTVEIIPSEAKRLREELYVINEFRLSLMAERVDITDMGWLDIDMGVLFSRESPLIEIKDRNTQQMVSRKILQYIRLVHEFVECILEAQKATSDPIMRWTLFPNERMRDIRQKLTNISDDLLSIDRSLEHPHSAETLPEME